MSLGVLNNISALYAENNLNQTQSSLQNVLTQLSSGSRINSGADDAAGLSLANGLEANSTALTQSAANANEGVGLLQVADGALSQVTSLLNRAVTLATEASNGTLDSTQDAAANQEYLSILAEIDNIGSTTTYNSQQVFGQGETNNVVSIYTSDSTSSGASVDQLTFAPLSEASVGVTGGSIKYTAAAPASGSGSTATSATPATITYTGATNGMDLSGTALYSSTTPTAGATATPSQIAAQAALTDLNAAISDVASERGYIGAQINTLNAVANVESTQQENVTSAENTVTATDYASATSQMSKYEILSQTGISALSQANSVQQEVLKLLQ